MFTRDSFNSACDLAIPFQFSDLEPYDQRQRSLTHKYEFVHCENDPDSFRIINETRCSEMTNYIFFEETVSVFVNNVTKYENFIIPQAEMRIGVFGLKITTVDLSRNIKPPMNFAFI